MKPSSYLPSSNPRVPAAEHPFHHCLDLQTRFTDIDLLGHVNNNVYLSMMDLGKLDYIKTISKGTMTVRDIRSVVVNVNCDFFEPAYFDEPLQVWTAVTHVGTRSFVIEQRIINSSTGHTKCIGRTTLAGFNPATAKGADLDPVLTATVAAFEGRPDLHIG
ncbi:MAG: acyl-CoA thioesterase [Bacteroides sp.]|nr:acyl-CoA thioesterase [Bacteroides sp.]MCM1413988.1 acyl-CoA thioesterase [Bacteroides sp.]MCM1471795.1 acyl-CoA thioesterase [Bacteroides sp.]